MKTTLFVIAVLMAQTFYGTTWEVEAGGGPDLGAPYFSPQNLVIELGDSVNWTWVSGVHNIIATSGPEAFDSGTHTAPFSWSKTFTLSGLYNYKCSLFNHALTQFGTITVGTIAVPNFESGHKLDFTLWPNPSNSILNIEQYLTTQSEVRLIDCSGKTVLLDKSNLDFKYQYDVSFLPQGIYIVEIRSGNAVARKKFIRE